MYLGVMYSSENDVSWCYSEFVSTPEKLKNIPDYGGNESHRRQAYFSACPVWI